MEWNATKVEDKIGIRFKHTDTLRLALIHPSYAKQINEPELNNKRLEFLGDAMLKLAVVEYLYLHFAHLPTAKLELLRDKLVDPKRLTKIWYDLQLGDAYPFLGLKEERHRLRLKQQNPFEKAFRALVGAIYLDRGFAQARNWSKKYLIAPVLKPYLKEKETSSHSEKQVKFLGDALLTAVAIDYLTNHILRVNPNKLKPLLKKLISQKSQSAYLKGLTINDWEEISQNELEIAKKSFKALLATIFLQFNADNSKDSFRKTANYFAEHFVEEERIMQEAIAILLKDGRSPKWIIHNVMGYPGKKFHQGRERFQELMGTPETSQS